jgi:nitrogenase molybdenum-iron protein NifN
MPLLHGSQGCTSFGLVLFVRHFREAIPLQTTAMSEVATVMGGLENLEQAIVNIAARAKPEIIGICSTGVTEIKGDDVEGHIKLIRAKHPELSHVALVYVSTPDFKDAFQDGWAKAVTRMVEQLVEPAPKGLSKARGSASGSQRVNVLHGSHLSPGDLEELRDIIESFGLLPLFLPDLSGSLDGHIPDEFTPTTLGGISLAEIAQMGSSAHTIAIGEQMRGAGNGRANRSAVHRGRPPNRACSWRRLDGAVDSRQWHARSRQVPSAAQPVVGRDARWAFSLWRQENCPRG